MKPNDRVNVLSGLIRQIDIADQQINLVYKKLEEIYTKDSRKHPLIPVEGGWEKPLNFELIECQIRGNKLLKKLLKDIKYFEKTGQGLGN